MCIYCNLTDPASQGPAADRFLTEYRSAQEAMARAVEAMLAVSRLDLKPEDRRRYDTVHKRMKSIARDWNMVEHERENAV